MPQKFRRRPTGHRLFATPPKCRQCQKSLFDTQDQARYAMGRVIAHTSTDMFDLHTYECPHNPEKWHFGHRSYFERKSHVDTVSADA